MKTLQLTQLDDGRQELRIELDEPYAGDALTWRGYLTIEPMLDAVQLDGPTRYELVMEARLGRDPEPFAVLELRRPPSDEPELLAPARQPRPL